MGQLGGPGAGPASIGGRSYPNSISVSACTVLNAPTQSYRFSLDGGYRSLRTSIGMDDESESRAPRVTVTISGDGRVLASRTARFGSASSVTANVSGVQRLTVTFRESNCDDEGGAAAVLGNPQLS
ncbi:NPCBM/NEW2 domain-containing protein [Dermacoccaceae bacterium W4C1]